ncbi:MAG: hypothetical protein CFH28_00365 [Alphaproteobacteria bacterium MarineAlpha6_Bin6]|nr:hypothetical protein [Pelagibacteraceae bacterium]PPR31781.1 MAG: hypothetical protein CFH28_00365 [Alphaproteobacteria bacterium MarineAlpha6_Bin6]PPR33106.1 MAG: hypothetical protein CFH27_00795 [Alphaproteobacteria bacterium MarineAlpha6_Bin5]|tara:strand:- start:1680 stop:1940 length:261 start_codon:yes stop_codon:yes gene_type:complete
MNEKKRTEIESEVFQKLIKHFRKKSDVQNIDLMNLADFCRNCLSKWYMSSAKKKGIILSYEEAKEIIYGMPYDKWKNKYQKPLSKK